MDLFHDTDTHCRLLSASWLLWFGVNVKGQEEGNHLWFYSPSNRSRLLVLLKHVFGRHSVHCIVNTWVVAWETHSSGQILTLSTTVYDVLKTTGFHERKYVHISIYHITWSKRSLVVFKLFCVCSYICTKINSVTSVACISHISIRSFVLCLL